MSPKNTKRQRRPAVDHRPGHSNRAVRAHAALHGDGILARPRSGPPGPDRYYDANAFMPDPDGGPARIRDDLAESLAEEFIQAATRGSDDDEALDGVVPEELGGPFVETSAAEEFANDTDDMNPPDAEPEPLPRPVAGLIQNPREPGDRDERDDDD